MAYTIYVEEQRETDADETRRELVRNLLKKLPESERTVMTLHYLGEMSCDSISKFLGVSSNTVRSRLNRARNRLKKEEHMIHENLSYFQLPSQMTENIMKKISQLHPSPTTATKPIVPYALSAVSAIFIFLLMGVGTQNMYRYQPPYSLEDNSQSSIEIVDAQIAMDISKKPTIRHQVGQTHISGESNGLGQGPDTQRIASAHEDENMDARTQWVQANGPLGGTVPILFTSTRGDIYAGTRHGLYRLNDDGSAWKLIHNINRPINSREHGSHLWWPIVERHDNLYLANKTEILVSSDRGETWKVFCKSKEGIPIGMIFTEEEPEENNSFSIYLAYSRGVFQTKDAGKSWIQLSEGLTDSKIRSISVIEKTIFAGTDDGLFRLNDGAWKNLSIGTQEEKSKTDSILDMATTDDYIYVVTGEKFEFTVSKESVITMLSHRGWSLYRSNDNGDTWDCIDPIEEDAPGIVLGRGVKPKIAAKDDKILVVDGRYHYISNDLGRNWSVRDINNSSVLYDTMSIIISDSNTFYNSGYGGINRTTDEGKTWHQFNAGMIATLIMDIVSVNNILYVRVANKGIMASSDLGKSWRPVTTQEFSDNLIVGHNGVLYVSEGIHPIMRLSDEENELTEVPGMPKLIIPNMSEYISEWNKIDPQSITQKEKGNVSTQPYEINIKDPVEVTNFAVSDSAFFAEYKNHLLRWKTGTSEWHVTDIKHEDKDEITYYSNFKISVSENTVFVGKRDGQLMYSSDEGNTWNNITASLPFSVEQYHDITFVDQTVFVATDKGVLRTNNGKVWMTVPDNEGKPLEFRKVEVYGNRLYGMAKNTIYQLKDELSTWTEVAPEIPYSATCFDVDDKNIYVGTFGQGVHILKLEDN